MSLFSDMDISDVFPELKRRWNVTLFHNEVKEDGVVTTMIEHFQNVRPTSISGDVVNHDGSLSFVDATGKKVKAAFVPFIAKEVEPTP